MRHLRRPTRGDLEHVARIAGVAVATLDAMRAGCPVPPWARSRALAAAQELRVYIGPTGDFDCGGRVQGRPGASGGARW